MMAERKRNYLKIPRDATFPTLPLPREFGEYSHAYYVGAIELWKATGEGRIGGVPRPDSLVYPILFLVHHFLELSLKETIALGYSIGDMTGELTYQEVQKEHDLDKLLTSVDSNLDQLDNVPKELPLTESTRQLIEDMNKFGMLGEALRYPLVTVKPRLRERMLGTDLPDSLIPDVAKVIKATEQAAVELGGLISYLMNLDDVLSDRG